MHASDKFAQYRDKKNSCLLLGLDPLPQRLPAPLAKLHTTGKIETVVLIEEFCREVIDACANHICGAKIQMACFECFGSHGMAVVEKLIHQCRQQQLLVIIDGKRGDVAHTSLCYAKAYLDPNSPLCGDALTIHPWLGKDSIDPFVETAIACQKMLFVLAHTSNPDAGMFQAATQTVLVSMINDYNLSNTAQKRLDGVPPGVVGAVVGATHSNAIQHWRKQLPASWLLCPGIGAQGGNLATIVQLIATNAPILVPISRSLLYASSGSDYALAAQQVAKNFQQNLHAGVS